MKLLKAAGDRTPPVRAGIVVPHLHRCPPKPPWMYAHYKRRGTDRRGWCEWCNQPILKGQRKSPTRATWHLECVNEYRMLFDWKYMRKLIKDRDSRTCAVCGATAYDTATEVDHIVPLHRWPTLDLQELTQDNVVEWYAAWLPGNLQTLCTKCHIDKTALECRARTGGR